MKNNKWLWVISPAAVVIILLVIIICAKDTSDDEKVANNKKENISDVEIVFEKESAVEEETKNVADTSKKPEAYENPLTFNKHAISQADYSNLTDVNIRLDGEINYDRFYINSIREFIGSTDDDNLVYSPLNVQMALSMLAEVTDGNSRQQILDALGVDSIEKLRKQAANIWKANYSNDGALTSLLANSIWLSNSINYNKDTLETLADAYFASSFSGVMGSNEYNKALQDWLNENTGNMLNDQISNIGMDTQTIASLASTVYFRAKWENVFIESMTKKETFYGTDGEKKCEFMHLSGVKEYYWGENFTAVSQNLVDGGAMWFILPNEDVHVNELIGDDEAMEFVLANGDWDNKKDVVVNMSVPKFDVSSQIQLENGLKGLGITDVFSIETADFSPLTIDRDDIEISDALHGARVTIDEEGCIATAYTVLMATGAAIPPDEEVDFVVNRPFLFVVTSDSGMPLFVGVVKSA